MEEKKTIIIVMCLLGMFLAGYVSGWEFSGVELDKPDQEIIDLAIQQTERETGSHYSLIPLYIETGEFVGFLSDINNTGKYMYLGIGDYLSIFQEN